MTKQAPNPPNHPVFHYRTGIVDRQHDVVPSLTNRDARKIVGDNSDGSVKQNSLNTWEKYNEEVTRRLLAGAAANLVNWPR